MFDAMLLCWNYLKEGFKQEQIIMYPTCIGFDLNGNFDATSVTKEFIELNSIYDGLYMSDYFMGQDIILYYFKFAKIQKEMTDTELFEMTSKKVQGIVSGYVARMAGCREINNVSSVIIGNCELYVYLARTQKGKSGIRKIYTNNIIY